MEKDELKKEILFLRKKLQLQEGEKEYVEFEY